ncbi:hypothetical protein BKA93DRAFT_141821 [Sparassis latifolia]
MLVVCSPDNSLAFLNSPHPLLVFSNSGARRYVLFTPGVRMATLLHHDAHARHMVSVSPPSYRQASACCGSIISGRQPEIIGPQQQVLSPPRQLFIFLGYSTESHYFVRPSWSEENPQHSFAIGIASEAPRAREGWSGRELASSLAKKKQERAAPLFAHLSAKPFRYLFPPNKRPKTQKSQDGPPTRGPDGVPRSHVLQLHTSPASYPTPEHRCRQRMKSLRNGAHAPLSTRRRGSIKVYIALYLAQPAGES